MKGSIFGRKKKRRSAGLIALLFLLILAVGQLPEAEKGAPLEVTPAAKAAESTGKETEKAGEEVVVVLEGSPLSVHVLDVGQGLAVLLESEGAYVLYDGGPSTASSKVVSYLKSHGVNRLEYCIASHYDEDHLNGVIGAIHAFEIGEVLGPDYDPGSSLYASFLAALEEKGLVRTTPEAGKRYLFGKASFTVLGSSEGAKADENDYSLVIKAKAGKRSILLMGDATGKKEAELLQSEAGHLHSNLLLLGHHGSQDASTDAFLDSVDPRYAILSCGSDNPYHHPDALVMERLQKRKIHLYRTDRQGDLLLYVNSEGKWDGPSPCDDYSDGGAFLLPSANGIPEHEPGDYSWVLGPDYVLLAYDEGIGNSYVGTDGTTFTPSLGLVGRFEGYENAVAQITPLYYVEPEADIPPIQAISYEDPVYEEPVYEEPVYYEEPASQGAGYDAGAYSQTDGSFFGGQFSGLNPFQQDYSQQQERGGAPYVLNTHTLKVHYRDCRDVAKIKPENYQECQDLTGLAALGYTACGHCGPPI